VLGLGTLDYVLIGIVAVSALVGLLRGLFREAMSLLAWAAALWVAASYGEWLAPRLAGAIGNAQLALWAARLALLVGVLIAGGIVTWVLAMALHATRLGATDRVVGLVFGLARGVLLVGLLVLALRVAGFTDEPWWRQSKLLPYAAPVAETLREAAEQGLGRSWSLSVHAFPPVPRPILVSWS
jgi:membrane protein required for colicin V production